MHAVNLLIKIKKIIQMIIKFIRTVWKYKYKKEVNQFLKIILTKKLFQNHNLQKDKWNY